MALLQSKKMHVSESYECLYCKPNTLGNLTLTYLENGSIQNEWKFNLQNPPNILFDHIFPVLADVLQIFIQKKCGHWIMFAKGCQSEKVFEQKRSAAVANQPNDLHSHKKMSVTNS